MHKNFEIEQGVPEIWGFKWLEMILLREKKRGKNTTALCLLAAVGKKICTHFLNSSNRFESHETFLKI